MAFTSRSVNLSWAPPFNADQVRVTHYVIQIRAGEETPWSEATEVETPDNTTLFQVKDLNPFTTYSFRVTALNSRGKSGPSESSFYMFTLREGLYRILFLGPLKFGFSVFRKLLSKSEEFLRGNVRRETILNSKRVARNS